MNNINKILLGVIIILILWLVIKSNDKISKYIDYQKTLQIEIDSLQKIISIQDSAYLSLVKEKDKIESNIHKISTASETKKIKELERELTLLRMYRDTVIYIQATPGQLYLYFNDMLMQ